MRNSIIEAFDLPSCWRQVIAEILDYGHERPVFRGAKKGHMRKELDSVTIHVIQPSVKLVPDVPAGVPPPTSMDFIKRYVAYLKEPEKADFKDSPDYPFGGRIAGKQKIEVVEGHRFPMPSIAQLDYIIKLLKETPETNRAVIQIGEAKDLSLRQPPSLRFIQMKSRYGRLHMWLVFRTWDAWKLPSNLAAFQLLKAHVAKEIGIKDGEIFAHSPGLHIYDDQWDLAEKVRAIRVQPTRKKTEIRGMRNSIIEAFDLPSCWFQVIVEILDHGYIRPVFRGARETHKRKELDSVTIHVTNPSMRPIVPDVPAGVPPPTSMKYVNKYVGYLITPDKADYEDYTYGERIAGKQKVEAIEGRRVPITSITQLDHIIKLLKETPETNRAVIEIGRSEDLTLRHPPCLRYIQMKVRYEKLHIWVVFRTWDAWAGLPSNLAAFLLLLEYIARQIGVEAGEMFAFSPGLHIYDDSWGLAEKLRSGESRTLMGEMIGKKRQS